MSARPTEKQAADESDAVRKFDAWMSTEGVSDHDRRILHRFRSMLVEEARTGSKAALGPDEEMSDLTMRTRETS